MTRWINEACKEVRALIGIYFLDIVQIRITLKYASKMVKDCLLVWCGANINDDYSGPVR